MACLPGRSCITETIKLRKSSFGNSFRYAHSRRKLFSHSKPPPPTRPARHKPRVLLARVIPLIGLVCFFSAIVHKMNTKSLSPTKQFIYRLNVFEQRDVKTSLFRTLLLRGDIPCQQSYSKRADNKFGTHLMWKIAPQDLDYSFYLPVFADG